MFPVLVRKDKDGCSRACLAKYKEPLTMGNECWIGNRRGHNEGLFGGILNECLVRRVDG